MGATLSIREAISGVEITRCMTVGSTSQGLTGDCILVMIYDPTVLLLLGTTGGSSMMTSSTTVATPHHRNHDYRFFFAVGTTAGSSMTSSTSDCIPVIVYDHWFFFF
jgi:hypothetical protein